MAYSFSSMSKQGVDGRRCNRTKSRTLKGGGIQLSEAEIRAIEARATQAVTQRRKLVS